MVCLEVGGAFKRNLGVLTLELVVENPRNSEVIFTARRKTVYCLGSISPLNVEINGNLGILSILLSLQ